MGDAEFMFAISLYLLLIPYVIDPPTPFEMMRLRLYRYLTDTKPKVDSQ